MNETDVTDNEEEELALYFATLSHSFYTLYDIIFFNFIIFPLGALLFKSRQGYVNDEDKNFWLMGGLVQAPFWGIFLLITLFAPSSITLAWLPFLVASGVVWPSCLAFYNS